MIIATAWGLRAALLLGAAVYAAGFAALMVTSVAIRRSPDAAGDSALAIASSRERPTTT
jgi:hypothetical protein